MASGYTRLAAGLSTGLIAAALVACNPPLPAVVHAGSGSVQSAMAPVRTIGAPTSINLAACQHLIAVHDVGPGPVRVAKAVGGSVASVRYWLRARPQSSAVLNGFPNHAHATVCVFRGFFPVPVPSGPVPTGARYIVNPAGRAVMDVAGPIQSVLSSTPSRFPPVTFPPGS